MGRVLASVAVQSWERSSTFAKSRKKKTTFFCVAVISEAFRGKASNATCAFSNEMGLDRWVSRAWLRRSRRICSLFVGTDMMICAESYQYEHKKKVFWKSSPTGVCLPRFKRIHDRSPH